MHIPISRIVEVPICSTRLEPFNNMAYELLVSRSPSEELIPVWLTIADPTLSTNQLAIVLSDALCGVPGTVLSTISKRDMQRAPFYPHSSPGA
jgi:hypothetical protein